MPRRPGGVLGVGAAIPVPLNHDHVPVVGLDDGAEVRPEGAFRAFLPGEVRSAEATGDRSLAAPLGDKKSCCQPQSRPTAQLSGYVKRRRYSGSSLISYSCTAVYNPQSGGLASHSAAGHATTAITHGWSFGLLGRRRYRTRSVTSRLRCLWRSARSARSSGRCVRRG
jgi:hypothetical protein